MNLFHLKEMKNAKNLSNVKVFLFDDEDHLFNINENNDHIDTKIEPIQGYADEPLLPLSKACAPLINIIENVLFYVQMALDKTPEIPSDGLTVDESASIRLYTMEWQGSEASLHTMLNFTLKYCDRTELVPYHKYLKLFLTALVKLPSLPSMTVWRGINKDVSEEFPSEISVTWWSFLSCSTKSMELEENNNRNKSDHRTLFSIESINCRTIHNHCEYPLEDEVILLPGIELQVQSQFMPAPDLHIVHLKQIRSNQTLLQPPFPGAKFYPDLKEEWYRKKKYIIPISALALLFIAAIIIGSVLGVRSRNNSENLVIDWQGNTWASSCDFHGKNFTNVSTIPSQCGPKCYTNVRCTHFTWVNISGGICFMKDGNVSKSDAFPTNDPSMLCGVEYLSNYQIVGGIVNWNGKNWTQGCDFPGNDLSNIWSPPSDCSGHCTNTSLCTHYMWDKYNGGTCFMKQGNISKEDARNTDDQQMICGITIST